MNCTVSGQLAPSHVTLKSDVILVTRKKRFQALPQTWNRSFLQGFLVSLRGKWFLETIIWALGDAHCFWVGPHFWASSVDGAGKYMVAGCGENTPCIQAVTFYSNWKLQRIFFLISPFSHLCPLSLCRESQFSRMLWMVALVPYTSSLALSCISTEQSQDHTANTSSSNMILAWFLNCSIASIVWDDHSLMNPLFLTFILFLIQEGFDGESWEVGRLCPDKFLNNSLHWYSALPFLRCFQIHPSYLILEDTLSISKFLVLC